VKRRSGNLQSDRYGETEGCRS